MSERDVRGKVILLYKDGDRADPANYRPIALLNVDYKILTGVITQAIEACIPRSAIPMEQMARKDVSGTMHGMMADKAHTETARKNIRGRGRIYNYSGWYDFKKAYDSVHQWQLLRLVEVLPLDTGFRDTLKSAINKWSVVVQVSDKLMTKPIRIRRGVYQVHCDTISPLLFVLMSASIIEHVKLDRAINRETSGRHRIIAVMDDIKVHLPTQLDLELITAAI